MLLSFSTQSVSENSSIHIDFRHCLFDCYFWTAGLTCSLTATPLILEKQNRSRYIEEEKRIRKPEFYTCFHSALRRTPHTAHKPSIGVTRFQNIVTSSYRFWIPICSAADVISVTIFLKRTGKKVFSVGIQRRTREVGALYFYPPLPAEKSYYAPHRASTAQLCPSRLPDMLNFPALFQSVHRDCEVFHEV